MIGIPLKKSGLQTRSLLAKIGSDVCKAELERAIDAAEPDRKTMAVNVASGSSTFTIAWRAALATFVILVVLTSFGVFWWWLLG